MEQSGYALLYVVATPIGNLGDLTARARQVLGDVDLIAAEDTRETRRLLTHLGISKPLVAYHDHNESTAAPRLIEVLKGGRSVALVSDAGTPMVSDPGYDLVRAAWEAGIRVVPVPGPSAVICALSAAGLPSDRFLFLGFPPRGSTQRRAWLSAVENEPGTLILYESGKRVLATLMDISQTLGQHRRVVLARELTKRFETFLRGTADDLAERLSSDPAQRLGEMVLLIAGSSAVPESNPEEQDRVLRILAEALPLSQAATLAARITGTKRNLLYQRAIELALGREP